MLQYKESKKALQKYINEHDDLYQDGVNEGISQGEERFGQLCMRLLHENKTKELEQGATDPECREILFCKYNI